jgi:hypothetical protein
MAAEDLDRSTNEKLFELSLGVADKAVDRARGGATFIQGAAAALGTLYTGILTFVFAAKDNPLPARGFVPTFFFALAVALAAFYSSFLSRGGDIEQPATDTIEGADRFSEESRMFIRLDWFVGWTDGITHARQSFLRAAVTSLAIGVFLMPVPFFAGATTHESTGTTTGSTDTPDGSTATPWPTPELTSPAELAAVLYEQQLQEFREGIADKSDVERADTAADLLTGSLFVIGVGLVALTLFWQRVPGAIRRRVESWLEPLE